MRERGAWKNARAVIGVLAAIRAEYVVVRAILVIVFEEIVGGRRPLDELSLLETLDAGKPIGDTTTVDVPGAAYCVEWFAEAIDKVGGEVVPSDQHLVGLVTREPLGVVAAVVPWNFPILMASWKFGPALAAGNSIVLKPSEKSPLTAIRVAQLAHEAGIPAGVFNVVPGGAEPGKLLDSGKRAAFQVKEGDRVLFSSYAGNEVNIDGQVLYRSLTPTWACRNGCCANPRRLLNG